MTGKPIKRVLFACNLNAIRSPMAEGIARLRLRDVVHADSCGIWDGGYVDPFLLSVMDEWHVDLSSHVPKTFEALDLTQFDVIIALTERARDAALARTSGFNIPVEFWALPDPSQAMGNREQRLQGYRDLRADLDQRLQERFAP